MQFKLIELAKLGIRWSGDRRRLLTGGHDGRSDSGGAPAWVPRLDGGSNSGDMRARHGGSGDEFEW